MKRHEIISSLMSQNAHHECLEYIRNLPSEDIDEPIKSAEARCYLKLSRIGEATAIYISIIKNNPRSTIALLGLGRIAILESQHQKAIKFYMAAHKVKPQDLGILSQLNELLLSLGLSAEAYKITSNAARLNIKSKQLSEMEAQLAIKCRDFSRSIEILNSLSQSHPNDPMIKANLANVLLLEGDIEAALHLYEELIQNFPNLKENWANYIVCLRQTNDEKKLLATIIDYKAYFGSADGVFSLSMAQIQFQNEEYQSALIYLKDMSEEVINANLISDRYLLLGKVYERLGNFTSAFHSFKRMNDQVVSQSAFKAYDIDKIISNLAIKSNAILPRRRPLKNLTGYDHKLAFIVGFPRSGTTLLDTILRGNAETCVLEEENYFRNARVKYQNSAHSSIEAKIKDAREEYFRGVRSKYADINNKFLIDKMPLSMIYIDYIKHIFPEAKIILSLRHPFDCVLSCYKQKFALNTAMAPFFDLHQAAKYYDNIFEKFFQNCKLHQIEYCEIKYENLVKSKQEVVAKLCGDIGLQFDVGMLDHVKTAKARKFIKTPSSGQVVKDTYTSSMFLYEKYLDHLGEIKMLDKWVKRLGYHF
jgi:tetratricopeptide (TPR) repeat protein